LQREVELERRAFMVYYWFLFLFFNQDKRLHAIW
jgi:hypothetical protein